MKTDNGKQGAWTYDLRVRDRMLASGALEAKALEKHLTELPDLEAQADSLPYEQPALGHPGSHGDGDL